MYFAVMAVNGPLKNSKASMFSIGIRNSDGAQHTAKLSAAEQNYMVGTQSEQTFCANVNQADVRDIKLVSLC